MSNTINLSKGQLALKQATSENIPNATINEIKEFSNAGLSNQDIADHFNISEKQVLWILNPQRGKDTMSKKPIHTNVNTTTIGVGQKSYDYITSLSHILGKPRIEIIDILVKHCKSDNSFLRKLVK